jgi:hypothetical protein
MGQYDLEIRRNIMQISEKIRRMTEAAEEDMREVYGEIARTAGDLTEHVLDCFREAQV